VVVVVVVVVLMVAVSQRYPLLPQPSKLYAKDASLRALA
jgi:hypothetical protein